MRDCPSAFEIGFKNFIPFQNIREGEWVYMFLSLHYREVIRILKTRIEPEFFEIRV